VRRGNTHRRACWHIATSDWLHRLIELLVVIAIIAILAAMAASGPEQSQTQGHYGGLRR